MCQGNVRSFLLVSEWVQQPEQMDHLLLSQAHVAGSWVTSGTAKTSQCPRDAGITTQVPQSTLVLWVTDVVHQVYPDLTIKRDC